MHVLSTFDGISCGLVALKQSGLQITKYYASEIDKFAIQISKKNHPEVEHVGDIRSIDASMFPQIDLLMAGSPCQDLSSINKSGKGLSGEKSSLFYEFIRLWKELKPKYFLLENVGSMKNADRDIISNILGVKPIKINSNMFVPQTRNRYYWTNIPNVSVPTIQRHNLTLQDVLVSNPPQDCLVSHNAAKYVFSTHPSWHTNPNQQKTDLTFARPLLTSKAGRAINVNVITTNQPETDTHTSYRFLTPVEFERLQGLPDNYTEGISNTQRYKSVGNGWTVPVISYILSQIPTTIQT